MEEEFLGASIYGFEQKNVYTSAVKFHLSKSKSDI